MKVEVLWGHDIRKRDNYCCYCLGRCQWKLSSILACSFRSTHFYSHISRRTSRVLPYLGKCIKWMQRDLVSRKKLENYLGKSNNLLGMNWNQSSTAPAVRGVIVLPQFHPNTGQWLYIEIQRQILDEKIVFQL